MIMTEEALMLTVIYDEQ